jgi:hypothetical protein
MCQLGGVLLGEVCSSQRWGLSILPGCSTVDRVCSLSSRAAEMREEALEELANQYVRRQSDDYIIPYQPLPAYTLHNHCHASSCSPTVAPPGAETIAATKYSFVHLHDLTARQSALCSSTSPRPFKSAKQRPSCEIHKFAIAQLLLVTGWASSS